MSILKPEVKRRWIKALKSGKYKKARGSLFRVQDGRRRRSAMEGEKEERGYYCCLGVLTEILEEPGEAFTDMGYCPVPINERAALDDKVEDWRTLQKKLAGINDDSGGFDKVIELIQQEA